MPASTIATLFGPNTTVDTTDPANPKLIIPFTDLADVGFTNVAKANDSEGWFTAIVKKARKFIAAQTDEVSNFDVDAPFLGLTTRNTVLMREYSYSIKIYEPDTGSAEPDPDNV